LGHVAWNQCGLESYNPAAAGTADAHPYEFERWISWTYMAYISRLR
jgi:hypothetical protein